MEFEQLDEMFDDAEFSGLGNGSATDIIQVYDDDDNYDDAFDAVDNNDSFNGDDDNDDDVDDDDDPERAPDGGY